MPQQQPDTLGGALITTVAADNVVDAGTSILDAALAVFEESGDAMLDAGPQILQHIPVVGVMFKLYKAGIAINQQAFAHKLAGFLHELGSVPLKTRRAFVNRFDEDLAFRQKVGDNLVLLLDKADDVDKGSLLGKLLTCYISGSIDYEGYMRFASIINRAHFSDVMALKKASYEEGVSEPEFTEMEIEGLSAAGIVSMISMANNDPFPAYEGPTDPPGPDRLFAHFTLLGKQLSKIIKQLY